MVRVVKSIKPAETINDDINNCFSSRKEMAKIKKVEAGLATRIKEYFSKNKINELDTGIVTAKVSIVEKSELNEEEIITFLKQKVLNKELSKAILNKIVQKREYIDSDNLEDALYKGVLSASELAPYQVINPTQKLTFKKG